MNSLDTVINFFLSQLIYSSAVAGSMNSAIQVNDTPAGDLPLDEDYLGKLILNKEVLMTETNGIVLQMSILILKPRTRPSDRRLRFSRSWPRKCP